MNRPFFALGLVAIVAACGSPEAAPAKPDKVVVTDAVVKLAPVQGRPSAGYFTITGGKVNDRLTAITSPKAATIELHESKMKGGMMRMTPLTGIEVPAGGTVTFKPGGNHAMLFGVDPSVKPGATIPLHFIFQSGASLDAQGKTIGVGDDMPMAMEHEGH